MGIDLKDRTIDPKNHEDIHYAAISIGKVGNEFG